MISILLCCNHEWEDRIKCSSVHISDSPTEYCIIREHARWKYSSDYSPANGLLSNLPNSNLRGNNRLGEWSLESYLLYVKLVGEPLAMWQIEMYRDIHQQIEAGNPIAANLRFAIALSIADILSALQKGCHTWVGRGVLHFAFSKLI